MTLQPNMHSDSLLIAKVTACNHLEKYIIYRSNMPYLCNLWLLRQGKNIQQGNLSPRAQKTYQYH